MFLVQHKYSKTLGKLMIIHEKTFFLRKHFYIKNCIQQKPVTDYLFLLFPEANNKSDIFAVTSKGNVQITETFMLSIDALCKYFLDVLQTLK